MSTSTAAVVFAIHSNLRRGRRWREVGVDAKRLKAKLLQASTSKVYGDPTVHLRPESYVGAANPIGPRACYDE